MRNFRFRHPFIALLVLVAMLFQGTWALGGTTGGLSGNVVLADTNAPVAGAKVSVSSPSEVQSTTTDAQGHFAFVSLAPDTYTVSVEKEGYQSVSQTGIAVFADNVQTVSISMLKVIGKVTTRAVSALVKPGTTADVYSINAATADKMTALGGGGGLNSAYSAISAVPGAYVPAGNQGWFQTVLIRGGDYDQVGYEFDGIPVNRSFDNYPSGNASALGQQELQVYTGAAPADAEAQGLSGFINQVIKTGTYPGFASVDLGIGAPTFYHKANFEIGGANRARTFSYYVGIGGYDQDYRFIDQNNGAGISGNWGAPFDQLPCPTGPTAINFSACYANGSVGPGGYIMGPYQMFSPSHISDRENVVNLHFAVPHKKDAGRDDIQLLYDTSNLNTSYYSSLNDWTQALFDGDVTGLNSGNGGAVGSNYPFYIGGFKYSGTVGTALPANYRSKTTLYTYPSSNGAWLGTPIDPKARDANNNSATIVKLQYQHNIGSSAYLRAYGYLFYSDWFLWGPNSTFSNYVGVNPPDYELTTHTHGGSISYANQINSKNLLNVQFSAVGASSIRNNNTEMLDSVSGSRKTFALLVNQNNPLSGVCYTSAGAATSCYGGSQAKATFKNAYAGTIPAAPAVCDTGANAGPCEWYVVESGPHGTFNNVKPTFYSFSISDQWKPTDRLLVNLGLRLDDYRFLGGDTTGPARNFWFNAWNASACISNVLGSTPVDKTSLGLTVAQPCSAANAGNTKYAPATLANNSSGTQTFNVWQPRVGLTYTVNPFNVLRASYGKYSQAPNSAFEQYNTDEQNLPGFLGPRFYQYGRTQPSYPIRPEVSNNFDFSWEHQAKGSDLSWKLTPFYRKTSDQIQQFYLDQKTNFVSGLNVGNQTSEGVEFQLNKGSFSQNGFAYQLSYTYTHSTIKFNTLSNGSTIVAPINNAIVQYNAFTSYCSTHATDARCGSGQQILDNNTATPIVAAPCYTAAGAAVALATSCNATDVQNPYWNAPVQSLLDPSASYAPFDLFPGGVGSSYNSIAVPHVATLVVNYKHDRWSVTPSLQFQAGTKYGAPESTAGVDPLAGCSPLAVGGTDPRNKYSSGSGNLYDATTCGSTLPIPDQYTGAFDNLGAFTAPSELIGNLQISYEASPRVTFQLTLANIVNSCFGGSSQAWTQGAGKNVCSYGVLGQGAISPVGNVYNPGAQIQPYVQYPYLRNFGPYNAGSGGALPNQPFNAYFDVKVKL
ncbi:TonB-dependent receptor [bacterium]|nr:MAG: TonB-dependent receptor [bacterium]